MKKNMRKYVLRFLGIGFGSVFIPLTVIIVVLVIVTATLGSAFGAAQPQTQYNGDGSLSESVLAYQPEVAKYCTASGIPEYTGLILAIMQQESGGAGSDPMQCSESPLNVKYEHAPNSIRDPGYSIEIGVMYFASCLRAAKVKSPQDIQGVSLALQGYNFGGGYINWALARGGYSAENAAEFSQMKAQQMGWSGYGDIQYVPHVLRYYQIAGSGSGRFSYPLAPGTYHISRGWGMDHGEMHRGIDFAAPTGTNIYAVASGVVVFSGFGQTGSGYGGYGNVVHIKHDSTYSSLYGHCSKLLVRTGEQVQKGQVIALIGSTGQSTGPHCHFEIRVNNKQVDPAPLLNMGK